MGGYGGCGNGWPNLNGLLDNIWGAGQAGGCSVSLFGAATNLVFGQNPPYYLDDFLAFSPKFFGQPTALSGCTTVADSANVTVPSIAGLNYYQFVQSVGNFPKGTLITGISGVTVTLGQSALASASNVTLMVYESQPVPASVVQLYLNLATASLVQARWQEQWYIAMALFIAHYSTLYARTDASETLTILETAIHGEVPAGTLPTAAFTLTAAPPGGALQALTANGLFMTPGVDYTLVGNEITLTNTLTEGALYATWPVQQQTFSTLQPTGAAVAAQGLAGGIQVSKGVGDVSVSYQPLASLEQFGQWQLTMYGQQLATMAAVIGAGPCVIY